MAKIVIDDIATQFGFKAAINDKLSQIEAEFNNKVLYRDNPTGEPNAMSSDIDMGGNDILNINKITVNDIGVVGESSFQEFIVEAQASANTAAEQATLSGLYKDAAQFAASQSSASATEASTSASEAQAAALLVDPRMDAVEAEMATQVSSISSFKADVSNLFGALIGSVHSFLCSDTYVPLGMVAANGTEYTRSQFPDLYDNFLVTGKLLTTTYTSFATQVGLTGNCGMFALDTANQKFKVPLLKDGDSITQASSAAELGKSVEAGLPNITATLPYNAWTGIAGSFYSSTTSTILAGGSSGSYPITKFDASLSSPIYGNSTTVTDEQVRLRHFVVVASAQNSASVFDWSAYMAGLAGKANVDLSNVTGNAIGFYFHARDQKTSGTNGGSTSAGAWHTRDINTIIKNAIGASLVSNRITLPAGTYYVRATMPAYSNGRVRAAIYNYTDGTYLLYGPTAYTPSGTDAWAAITLCGVITVNASKAIELRMYSQSAHATGMGLAASISGVPECYSEVEIWKV